ncbi:diguanylate cyclase [Methylomonas sp. AM2-LC]|uniref:sensor domain-containing diguanylate cyclase n=1 Tax=Methylomonas sp. AM2-LC TaxID=3153301 RepID=UPI0032675CA1
MRVDAALFDHLIAYSSIPLIGSALGSLLITVSQLASNESRIVLGWLGLVYLTLGIRIWLTQRCKRQLVSMGYDPAIAFRYAMTTGLSGIAWGMGGCLLSEANPTTMIITITAMQAMVMGGVLTLGTYMPSFLAFAIPATLPMSVALTLNGGTANSVLAVYNFIFLLIMINIAQRVNNSIRSRLQLTFENEDLVKALSQAHAHVLTAKETADQAIKELETIYHNIWVGIIVLSTDRVILRTNRHFEEIMFRWQHNEMIGKSTRIVYASQEDFELIDRTVYPQFNTGKNYFKFESLFIRKDGTQFWGIAVGSFIDPTDIEKGLIWFIHDISEEHHSQEELSAAKESAEQASLALIEANNRILFQNSELERLCITDQLTGLYNRRKLDQVIVVEQKRLERTFQALSIILTDLDNFKSVNDVYGHQAGDVILSTVAQLLKQELRESDILGRWGGEEFMIICLDTDLNGALALAEKLRKTLENHVLDIVGTQTCSFGVAQLTQKESIDSLITRADNALYSAKDAGRNCVHFDKSAAE